jgi:hypothetical protein
MAEKQTKSENDKPEQPKRRVTAAVSRVSIADKGESGRGLLPTVVDAGSNLSLKVADTVFAVAHDARSEVFGLVGRGLDLVEDTQDVVIGLLRSTLHRVDSLSFDALDAGEHITAAALTLGKKTGDDVAKVVNTTAQALTTDEMKKAA